MPWRGIAFAAIVLLGCAGPVLGQADIGARLSVDRLGDVETGIYAVSNGASFSLNRYDDKFLMQFAGDPEIYVLYSDNGSLGGRILRYDSGETALAISGWGAVTVYTDAQPAGLPADRSAGSETPVLHFVSLGEMQEAAADEGTHLSYTRGLNIGFDADWSALVTDINLRKQTFDTMQNAARGIDRFAATPAGRAALGARVENVHIVIGGKPQIVLHGRTLLVTFSPSRGFAGRASSHGIARALGRMFSVPTAG
ncbi:MAG TPA: DUF4908 domain-containing protein [Rhizomicrobium sp.]